MFRWLSVSLVFHLVLAWFSLGFYHFDEHYQILEFASYKAGLIGASHLTWEYHAQIRSAFQPYIAYCIIRILQGLQNYDPYNVATILRFISAILGWGSTLLVTIAGLFYVPNARMRKIFTIMSCVLAPLIFIHIRFSGEGWSGSLVFAGIALVLLLIQKKNEMKQNKADVFFIISGFLMGLACICRFQTAIIVFAFFVWLIFISKLQIKTLFFIVLGIFMAVLGGILLDRLFYGQWVNTAYRYFDVNLVQGVANSFGTEPWWWYAKAIAENGVFVLQILMMLMVLIAFITKWKNPFVWVSAFFLIIHCIISHKELRFLFPLINAMPILLILGFDSLFSIFITKESFNKMIFPSFVSFFVLLNTLSITYLCIKPPSSILYAMRYLYRYHPEPVNVIISDINVLRQTEGYLRMNFYERSQTHFIFLNKTDKDSVINLAKNNVVPLLLMEWEKGFDMKPAMGLLSVSFEASYTQLPRWLERVNFNHWVDRTSCWQVHKIKI